MKLKEYKINKIIKYNGIRLRVEKAVQNCRGCYFKRCIRCPVEIIGVCSNPWREINVIFRKIDKYKKENKHGRKSQNNQN